MKRLSAIAILSLSLSLSLACAQARAEGFASPGPIRTLEGQIHTATDATGEPCVVFRCNGEDGRSVQIHPTTPETEGLIRVARNSPGPVQAVLQAKSFVSLDGKPALVVQAIQAPAPATRFTVDVTAAGFKLPDGRVLPGFGPLAELFNTVNAIGSRCEVFAQVVSVHEGGTQAPYLHVLMLKVYPLPGAKQVLDMKPRPLEDVLIRPMWIGAPPKLRDLLGKQELSVRIVTPRRTPSKLKRYARVSDVALSAPREGEACVGLGTCLEQR